MNYAIIGSGNVGSALALQFARNGIAVGLANSRGPDSITPPAGELAGCVTPLTLQQAVEADVVILAVPFRAHADVARAASDWSGKIVVDAMNTYGVEPSELKGMASSHVVAAAFPGARVVKTFNQLPARLLASDPVADGGRRVMFLASDDADAAATIGKLVSALGFAPLLLGSIGETRSMLEKGGALVLQNLVKQN